VAAIRSHSDCRRSIFSATDRSSKPGGGSGTGFDTGARPVRLSISRESDTFSRRLHCRNLDCPPEVLSKLTFRGGTHRRENTTASSASRRSPMAQAPARSLQRLVAHDREPCAAGLLRSGALVACIQRPTFPSTPEDLLRPRAVSSQPASCPHAHRTCWSKGSTCGLTVPPTRFPMSAGLS
jgi:hypothetical protein